MTPKHQSEPDDAPSTAGQGLAQSARKEAEITQKLYRDYRKLRAEVYNDLCQRHPNLPKNKIFARAQTLLNNVIRTAFAESRGLLPANTLKETIASRGQRITTTNPFHEPREACIDMLELSDGTCKSFELLCKYDFREDVSVDVLGHIFEQSISDLEELRAENEQAQGGAPPETPARRKAEGIFYTPSHITQYIVEETLGKAMDEQWQAALLEHRPLEQKTKAQQDKAWQSAWESYRDALQKIRVLDLACGAGAFLVAAFDRLARAHEGVNAALAELGRGQVELFHLDKTVLNNNLFGVDINGESVEIAKLSLWLKTAQRNRPLTCLDHNIKQGNAVVSDAMIDPLAFEWSTGRAPRLSVEPETPGDKEIDARWREGFDVILGNPPYVRQEWISAYKDHLGKAYQSYHGMADLYVYFIERAIRNLKPGGRLGFIVANKWMRSAYGENLRKLLARDVQLNRIVDFGHAPIFPDADTFPCILILSKSEPPAEHEVEVTRFPREALGEETLQDYVGENHYQIPQKRLGAASWSLEPPAVEALMDKIRERGVALWEYAKQKPYRGVLTGYNEAFLIDTATRDQLIKDDPKSGEIIKKYLRGQDVRRWAPEWEGLWMIILQSSHDHPWPWAGMDESKAEACFAATHPGLHARMKPMEQALRKRADQGRYWWELRRCVYYEHFAQPKIVWKDLSFHSAFCMDGQGYFTNNLCYFITNKDAWLLAALNSPLIWSYLFRHTIHGKDEVLRLRVNNMETLPVAPPSPEAREQAEIMVPRIIELTQQNQEAHTNLMDILRLQCDIEKPGQKLEDFSALDADAFVNEIKARRPKNKSMLKPAQLKDLRGIHTEESAAVQARRREMAQIERSLATLVYHAYQLTPEEIALLWSTAPPRMPDANPHTI